MLAEPFVRRRIVGLAVLAACTPVEHPAFAVPAATSALSGSLPATAAPVAAGWNYSCARQLDRTARCWGTRWEGRRQRSRLARPIEGLGEVAGLAIGEQHVCAVVGDGTVRCWGGNHSGQIGDATTEDRGRPTIVPGLDEVVEVALGSAHSCARISDGTLMCWGDNDYGQLGDGTAGSRTRPPSSA